MPTNRTPARVLGLIAARGGSKGIPGKNVALLGGRPLLAWTIDAARACGVLDRVMVSTDDADIAAAARASGADVPFMRPATLAADDTPSNAVVVHTLEWLSEHEGEKPDYVALLQPTSPFRSAGDIAGAVTLALERKATCVVSVTPFHGHPSWIMRLDASGAMRPWAADAVAERRQDRDVPYVPNGAVFVVRSDVVMSGASWYGDGVLGYVMPQERSLDIDTPWDLRLGNLLAAVPPAQS